MSSVKRGRARIKSALDALKLPPAAVAADTKDSDDESSEPAPATTGDMWASGVNQIRKTCDWLVGTMGAVAVAAVGSGAVLSFEHADSWLRVGWIVWGLSMTVVGALVVAWIAMQIKLPISQSAAALVAPHPEYLGGIPELIQESRRKQLLPSVQEELQHNYLHNRLLKQVQFKAAALAGKTDESNKELRDRYEAMSKYYQEQLVEGEGEVRSSLGRALYLSLRKRFFDNLQWILVGAIMVAVGFPTYFAAARLDLESDTAESGADASEGAGETAPSGDNDEASPSSTVPATATARFKDPELSALSNGCVDRNTKVLVLNGNGSEAAPWKLRVLPSESCPSAFDLIVTRDQATMSFDSVDPALSALHQSRLDDAGGDDSEPSGPKLDANQILSMIVWIFTATAYFALFRMALSLKDHEQGTA